MPLELSLPGLTDIVPLPLMPAVFCELASWPRSLASYSLQGGNFTWAGSPDHTTAAWSSLSRAEPTVHHVDGLMTSSVSRSARAVGEESP